MQVDPQERERAIQACIDAHLAQGDDLTISLVAAEAGVSSAAVFRFAQKKGFPNWSSYLAHALQTARADSQDAHPIGKLERGVRMVAYALRAHREGTILVAACGDAEICAQHALMRLATCGYHVLPYAPAVARAHRDADHPGLVLVFNESGIALWDCCRVCAQEGFEVVAVTASTDSPVARAAHVSIAIQDRKSSLDAYEPNYFAAGTIAFMSRVLDLIDEPYLSSGQ